MKTTLALWMKIALTAVVISALLYAVGYQVLSDQSDIYLEDLKEKETYILGG